ncbi:MAG: MFS transporter, partial [Candidatus Cybelea sp.]
MNRLLWTLALGVFAGALDLSVLSPALPALGQAFTVQTGDLAWIFTVYLLVTVVSIAVAGSMADRFGRRPIYLICISLFAAGSIVAILAPNYPVFLAARAIQALGAGGIFPVATAAIGDVVPAARRGAALGIVAATWGFAAVIGPSIGGVITHYVSWRYIFVLNLPLAAIVFAMALKEVPANAPRQREALDVVGLALLCGGLLALMDGLISSGVATGLAGVALLVGFAFWERSARNPIVPL